MKLKQFWSDLGGKLGVGLIGAGFLLVFLGWNGAASVDRVPAQFPYLISGGIGGLCLVIVGVGLLIVQNQRADRAALQASLVELRRALTDDADPALAPFEPPPPRTASQPEALEIVDPSEPRSRRPPLRAGR